MGWSRISSIDIGAGNLLLLACSQALSNWIKKSSLFYFCKFLCLLYLTICFCLKRAKSWLEFSIKSKFNRYNMRSFQRVLVGFNNLWILFLQNLIECLVKVSAFLLLSWIPFCCTGFFRFFLVIPDGFEHPWSGSLPFHVNVNEGAQMLLRRQRFKCLGCNVNRHCGFLTMT